MDWVEKRARSESLLKANAPRLWDYLCIALEHAANSYSELYGDADKGDAKFNRQYWENVNICWEPRFTDHARQRQAVDVRFDVGRKYISASYRTPQPIPDLLFTFVIADEDSVAFADRDGKLVNEEQICKRILEPMLFPNSKPLRRGEIPGSSPI